MINKIFNTKKYSLLFNLLLLCKFSYLNKKIRRNTIFAIISLSNYKQNNLYLKQKIKSIMYIRKFFILFNFSGIIRKATLIFILSMLNSNCNISSILIQSFISKNMRGFDIKNRILYKKDAEITNSKNIYNFKSLVCLNPCIVDSIMMIFNLLRINSKECNATIIGSSNNTGGIIFLKTKDKFSSLTVINKTNDNFRIILNITDILILSFGKYEFISKNFIKNGSMILDLGINIKENLIRGDSDKNCSNKASILTIVPNGLGLLTTLSFLKNTLFLYLKNNK